MAPPLRAVAAPPLSSLPPSIGPYRITGLLGRGGMGVVYRGEHVDTGERVAVKTVLSASGTLLATLRREIHALGRVRHPGIVRIVADGVHGGRPWYAMDLLEGRTLRQHLIEMWETPLAHPTAALTGSHDVTVTGGPSALSTPTTFFPDAPRVTAPSLGATLGLLRRICAPLAFLHGAGIVHCDLKPENVFLRESGRPVLVDLGIALSFDGAHGREALTAEGQTAGTAAYMAPEQIAGELVDARADLYALGCILYECATGRPPFTGAYVGSILYQHRHDAPVPPSCRADGVPVELDRLILKLLEKRPRDRLGYADDVAAVLDALNGDCAPEEGPRPRTYVYRPELAGRADTLGALAESVAKLAQERRGGIVLVRGESGVGKTRLLAETGRIAAQRRLAVITGQCVALGSGEAAGAGAPLYPLRPLLLAVADRATEHGRAETDRLLGSSRKLLATYEPALADLPGHDEQPELAVLAPEAARGRVLGSLTTTLFALADASPLVLMLDDLQWADELTLSLLEALAHEDLAKQGVLIVGAYRIEEARAELSALERAATSTTLALGRLDAAGVSAMVSGMLALHKPPSGFLDAMVAQSSGNPFFVAEYLRAAIGEGMLRRDAAGRWRFDVHAAATDTLSAMPLPHRLGELLARRLDRLDAGGRAILAWGAVLGREMDAELLTAGVEGNDSAMDAIAALREQQILEEAGGGRLRFVHDKIREIAYARIPDAECRALHGRAGDAIEARSGDAADAFPALGHHFSRAGAHGKGGRYYARAAERARAAYANGDAISLFRGAIENLRKVPAVELAGAGEHEPLARLHEQLGDVLALTGRRDEAREALEVTLAATPGSDGMGRALLHRKIGKAWEVDHAHAEAFAAFDAAEANLGAVTETGDTALLDLWILLQIDRISIHYWRDEPERIAALVERVRPVVEQRGTLAQRARFFQALIHQNIRRERYAVSAETVEITRACLAAREQLDDAGEIRSTRFALATVLLWHGALEEAEARMKSALEEAERVGDTHHEARCLTYLAILYRLQGRVDDAHGLLERSQTVATAAGLADYAGAAVAGRAWVAWRDGDHAAVDRLGREALSLWQPIASAYAFPFQWTARLPLVALELGRGRLEEAIEQARAVLDEKQQRLPDDVAGPFERGIDAWEQGRRDSTPDELARGIAAAVRLRRL